MELRFTTTPELNPSKDNNYSNYTIKICVHMAEEMVKSAMCEVMGQDLLKPTLKPGMAAKLSG